MRLGILVCFVVLLVSLSMGCEHAGPLEVDTTEATFSNVQATVFNLNCALSGCHTGANPPPPNGGMNLSEGQAYANIVGVMSTEQPGLLRVAPGDPDNSYLVKKIQGDPDISGMRMPFGRPALPDELITLVRTWIAEGAQNN